MNLFFFSALWMHRIHCCLPRSAHCYSTIRIHCLLVTILCALHFKCASWVTDIGWHLQVVNGDCFFSPSSALVRLNFAIFFFQNYKCCVTFRSCLIIWLSIIHDKTTLKSLLINLFYFYFQKKLFNCKASGVVYSFWMTKPW